MSIRQAVRKVDRVVEFIQYNRDNIDEIDAWMGKKHERVDISNAVKMFQLGCKYQDYIDIFIGKAPLVPGDYVVKSNNLFYIWNAELFDETFEVVCSNSQD